MKKNPWMVYENGNYKVALNIENGTKIRMNNENSLVPAFAESIDLNITNKCDNGCPYCYQGCGPEGRNADLDSLKFLDTLHPYTELAINGNEVDLPFLMPFLEKMKEKKVIVNMTVSQRHFMMNKSKIALMQNSGLLHGLGISFSAPDEEFFDKVASPSLSNVVIHTIAGVTTVEDYKVLEGKDLRILILGYKHKGRGIDFYSPEVEKNILELRNALPDLMKGGGYKVLSFDNLALEQLYVKDYVDPQVWEQCYMGEEATYTFYIDAVARKFGGSSLVAPEEMLPILDNVDDMFTIVRSKKW